MKRQIKKSFDELRKNSKKLKIILYGNFACNNNCIYCACNERRGFSDFNFIKKYITKHRKYSDFIGLSGGEPTIHPNFFYMLKLISKLRFKTVEIQTNGRMFAYKDFCEKVVKMNIIDIFVVSLNSLDEKMNMVRMRGGHNEAIRGIKNLKKFKQKVFINTVVCRKNYRDLEKIVKNFINLKVDYINLIFMRPTGTAGKNFDNLVVEIKKVLPFVKKSINLCKKEGIVCLAEGIPYCLMKGYEKNISEIYNPPKIRVIEKKLLEPNKDLFSKDYKRKGKMCKKCKYDTICEGIWKEYAKRKGFSELTPVSSI